MFKFRERWIPAVAGLGVGLLMLSGCQDRFIAKEQQVETFKQDTSVAIDILWVLDTSESTDEEVPLIQAGAASFVEALASSNADYRIGLINMNIKNTTGNQAGKLYAAPGFNSVIKAEDGREAVINAFNETLNYMQTDAALRAVSGKGCEAGLEAARLAVDTTLDGGLGLNPDFLRPQANLAVIFVTDEDDTSTNPQPDDVCEGFDSEITAYPKIYETVAEYLNFFRGLKGNRFSAHGILTLNKSDPICATANPREESVSFLEAVNETSGFAASVCLSDYSAFLDDLGLKIASLATKFALKLPPDTATLEVSINDTALTSGQFSYDESSNAVVLDIASVNVKAGDTITVRYFSNPQARTLLN